MNANHIHSVKEGRVIATERLFIKEAQLKFGI